MADEEIMGEARENFSRLRIMHIDTSRKFYERKSTEIAFKIAGNGFHKGLGLSLKLKKELEKTLNADKDYARLYAICIYYLIENNLELFDELIICGDENFNKVKNYLNLLFEGEDKYATKVIKSISALRREIGDKNIRSYADDIAYSYMRRALKSVVRRQKGIPLNAVKVNYKMIVEKWLAIEEKIKKGGE